MSAEESCILRLWLGGPGTLGPAIGSTNLAACQGVTNPSTAVKHSEGLFGSIDPRMWRIYRKSRCTILCVLHVESFENRGSSALLHRGNQVLIGFVFNTNVLLRVLQQEEVGAAHECITHSLELLTH